MYMAIEMMAPSCYHGSAPGRSSGSAPNAYAKGLLKPFKGKGSLIRLRDELEAEAAAMVQEAVDIEQRYNFGLLSKLGLLIRHHGEHNHRVPYLRWRDRKAKKMGNALWEGAMARRDLSEPMRRELYDIEVLRCLFNAQAGVINSELRRLRTVIPTLERADQVLAKEV
ncbi:DUF3158 family protein [Billgrantia montanilacus]|uniref:DUF3158 family protein n=2 Tax=Billgrantia montanilacus TaxID=2282305 RepID=A0A368TRD5_9GAMM|nr:DUF3158 family protein [Halomonas montanilacus]